MAKRRGNCQFLSPKLNLGGCANHSVLSGVQVFPHQGKEVVVLLESYLAELDLSELS